MIPDTVRIIIACGEKLNNLVVQGLYDATTSARIYNLYGPTEYTTYATAALTVRGAERDPPIGRPLCNTRVYILDAQRQFAPRRPYRGRCSSPAMVSRAGISASPNSPLNDLSRIHSAHPANVCIARGISLTSMLVIRWPA